MKQWAFQCRATTRSSGVSCPSSALRCSRADGNSPRSISRIAGLKRGSSTSNTVDSKLDPDGISRIFLLCKAGGPGLLPGAILNFGQQNQVTVGAPEPALSLSKDLALFETWVGAIHGCGKVVGFLG